MLLLPPGAVTGNKRKLFPAASGPAQAPAVAQHSALYRINRLWDAALEKRMKGAPPDPQLFAQRTFHDHPRTLSTQVCPCLTMPEMSIH